MITLDAEVEKAIISGLTKGEQGIYISMSPELMQKLISQISEQMKKFNELSQTPIILTSNVVRAYFYRLIEQFYPNIYVLSFNEISNNVQIQGCYMYKQGICIAVANGDITYEQVLIAKAADTMLSIEGVAASFVIAKREDQKISISARSNGKINVQIIMEQLKGGGHLTNAATQIENKSVQEVEQLLKEKIDLYLEGGEE